MIVFFNHIFISKTEVKIEPDDRGFLFADGVYEVIRSYRGKLFKADEHIARLDRSLRYLRIDIPDKINFKNVSARLIEDNNLKDEDATIYIQITRGSAPRKHSFPEEDIPPTIYASASTFQRPEKKQAQGVKVILEPDNRWARCDIKSIALLPNVLANQRAKEDDAEEAILIRDGVALEGSHSSFCGVFNNRLITAPKSNYILAGITRDVVLQLCQELNIVINEFSIFANRLKAADELMILSTTMEVMPVIQVNDWKVGNGKPGPITRKLQQAFEALITESG
jgi:D-alanine transaminase